MKKDRVMKPFGLLATVCVVCLVGVFLWQCASAWAQAASKEPYKLGYISSYEGQSSTVTTGCPKALDFLLERVNKTGGINGHPLEIVRIENQSRPEFNAVAVRSLVQKGVSAILGPTMTSDVKVAEPLGEEFHISLVTASGGYRPPKTTKYIYSMASSGFQIHEAQIQYFKKKGATTMGILADTAGTGEATIDQAGTVAKKHNMKLAIERFNISDFDVTPQLIKLFAAKVDWIYLGTSGGQILTTLSNYKALNRDVPLVLSWSVQEVNWLKQIIGKEPKSLYIAGGCRILSSDTLDPKDPMKKTLTWVEKAFPEWAVSVAGDVPTSYLEGGIMLCSALQEVGPDREAINNWIDTKVRNMHGFFNVYDSHGEDWHKMPVSSGFLGRTEKGKWMNLPETMTILSEGAQPMPILKQMMGEKK